MERHKEAVEKLLYDRLSAAAALSISPRSVDYLIANRRLGTRRIGKRVLIPAAELKKFARADHFGPVRCRRQKEADSEEAA